VARQSFVQAKLLEEEETRRLQGHGSAVLVYVSRG
jgi:hypothetical protein